VVGAAAGQTHSLLWTDTGVVLGSGSNKYGQVGGSAPRLTMFEPIEFPPAGHGGDQNSNGSSSSSSISGGAPTSAVMAACGQNHSIVLRCVDETSTSPAHTRVFTFGSNNFGQVDGGASGATMFRQPLDVSDALAAWGVKSVLYVAAGGDQTFAVGCRDDDDDAGPGPSSTLLGANNPFLKRQFSTKVPLQRRRNRPRHTNIISHAFLHAVL